MDNKSLFLNAISHNDAESLNALLLLMQDELTEELGSEEYAGTKRFFARIACTLDYHSDNSLLDFSNILECTLAANLLIPFLFDRYKTDMEALSKCARKGKMTQKQFLYELASQKTYPRTFIENLADRLRPFHNCLAKYNVTENGLSLGMEKLFKDLAKPKSCGDIISGNCMDLGNYIDRSFLKSLIDANEKVDSLENINVFSKEPYFPVYQRGQAFFLLNYEALIDYFYKSVHRLAMGNSTPEERDLLMNAKGKNFNEMCAHLFRDKFGFNDVYENIEYQNGEIDLMVIDSDCLFIVECKSRNYTSKISGLNQSYIKANRSNLDGASGQLTRFLDYAKGKGNRFQINKNCQKSSLQLDDFSFVIPIVLNLDNLSELNNDYDSRNRECVYLSYDDLTIIQDIIGKRKWLLVDFLQQLFSKSRPGVFADDTVDMFAFYCRMKNIAPLFDAPIDIVITELGNDFFKNYFSYETEKNPIQALKNDINTFEMAPNESYSDCIERYHRKHWVTIEDILSKKF